MALSREEKRRNTRRANEEKIAALEEKMGQVEQLLMDEVNNNEVLTEQLATNRGILAKVIEDLSQYQEVIIPKR